MDKIIGYWWEGDEFEVPIVRKGDNKYYKIFPKTDDEDEHTDEFYKEQFQYCMTNPFSSTDVYHERSGNKFIVSYNSPIYDFLNCRIIGEGDSLDDATFNLIENVLDVMRGYNKNRVDEFMNNFKHNLEGVNNAT